MEEHLCVDEQICSTKALNTLKRYKPHKWGYKVFILSGVSGFAYKTEIETGQENVVLQDEPDSGASSNVVMRLARIILRQQKFMLYFDNYFTSFHLLEYLAKVGILSLGTVRRNRITDCKLLSEKIIMKKERGYSEEYVADVNGIDISTVAWKDSKIINLPSTFAGQKSETDIRKWDKQNSKYMNIKRPNVVGEYNRYMGGVDLLEHHGHLQDTFAKQTMDHAPVLSLFGSHNSQCMNILQKGC
ncbi:PiggyBac transposable element-derived protein 1 [Eumeta japonica]|uniref:PiggyBac transposable element-derived protein 1 n=1 Tax=Eumeta variegata TaxID=151549 RepID=A0A4C1UA77_EUMVA|nr:PiggyBac transposable element-derived protein 1 [Eumeta japonica]